MGYFKLHVLGTYSENSDYSDPTAKFVPAPDTLTINEYLHCKVDAATGGGATLDLALFAEGIKMLMVKNLDTTIAITAQFNTAGDAAVSVVIPGGGMMVTPDVLYGNDLILIAASGTPLAEVMVLGT
tara:strand:+ start:353 stop:733 length:381 start_codon:yes stop_codon:yes gene_type:complete